VTGGTGLAVVRPERLLHHGDVALWQHGFKGRKKLMKKIYLVALTALIFAAAGHVAYAQDEAAEEKAYSLSGNFAIVSEYMFRGISQVDGEPTIQGGLDLGYDNLYLGVWGSGVDFTDATTEMDIYGGITGEENGISWDLGIIWYLYPGSDSANNYDFAEGYVAFGYDFGPYALSTGISFSPEYFGDSGDAIYWSAGVDVPLTEGFAIGFHAGYQSIDDNTAFGVPDYLDWSITVSREFEGFGLSLAYIDTDLEDSDCSDACATKVIGTISRGF